MQEWREDEKDSVWFQEYYLTGYYKTHYNNVETHSAGTGRIVYQVSWVLDLKVWIVKLSTNLTKGRDRIEKEFALAPYEKVLLVENAGYSDIADGNYRGDYNKKSFLASIHTFWFKYHIPVFFMPDHKYSPLFIKKYFEYYLKNYMR